MGDKLFAWLVHVYTAAGLLLAAGMVALIVRGGDASFRAAFGLMVAAVVVDSTDGWLARRARVKDVLPQFDGRTLDDLTDFHTYTSIPLFLIWRADLLPGRLEWLLLLPLLASAYGFSQTAAKTADGFFLGFPSWWNAVAFYLYMLVPPAPVSVFLILLFSILTFVPSRYLYPSRGGPYARFLTVAGIVWAVVMAAVLLLPPERRQPLVLVSSAYPAAYLVLSWLVSARRGSGVSRHSFRTARP